MANVLVTGGLGLVGWRVTEQLVAEGHKVFVFCRGLANSQENLTRLKGDVEMVVGDVTDLPLILGTLKRNKITHIIHLAAMIGLPSATNPAKSFLVNTIGTANIFDAALATDVERVAWASTTMAAGVTADYRGEIVDETFNGRPTTAYGAAKWGAEIISQTYRDMYGLKTVCIRPCLAFGIGREGFGAGFLAEAVHNMVEGRVGKIFDLGQGVPHQPIYDKDMAALFIKATFGPMPQHHMFNTPVDRNYPIKEMAEVLERVVPGAKVEIVKFSDAYLPPAVASGELARKEFDFTPRYTFEMAIREMAEFYRSKQKLTG